MINSLCNRDKKSNKDKNRARVREGKERRGGAEALRKSVGVHNFLKIQV